VRVISYSRTIKFLRGIFDRLATPTFTGTDSIARHQEREGIACCEQKAAEAADCSEWTNLPTDYASVFGHVMLSPIH
jgi:hypothetical protein